MLVHEMWTGFDAACRSCAVQVMGDAKLKVIAAELITKVKKSVTIDWMLRAGARAKAQGDGEAHP